LARIISIIFLIKFIILGSVLALAVNQYYFVKTTKEQLLEIPKNAKISEIAQMLEDKNVVNNKLVFKIFAYLHHKNKSYIQNGEYLFESGMTLSEVFSKILSGDRYKRYITIPEGYTNFQIINFLNETKELNGEIILPFTEGSLLPETYLFYKGETRLSIMNRMANKMKTFLTEAWQNKADNLEVKTVDEALVLASIIEKETSINNEREIVSSVYQNRLRKGMPLQADPTVIYGIKEGKTDFSHVLSRTDLKHDTPYNTYIFSGLPPTPICNPGRKSITAALHPARTELFFFVADGKGGHNFANDYKNHLNNVSNYRKELKLQKD